MSSEREREREILFCTFFQPFVSFELMLLALRRSVIVQYRGGPGSPGNGFCGPDGPDHGKQGHEYARGFG